MPRDSQSTLVRRVGVYQNHAAGYVSGKHSRVYMSLPERRRFILSIRDDTVYMHYLEHVPTTSSDAIWWGNGTAVYYVVCETKPLANQEKVFYIKEAGEKAQVFVIHQEQNGAPTFLSKATVNPVMDTITHQHCDFDEDGDETLVALDSGELARIANLPRSDERLASRLKEFSQLDTADCDVVPLSNVVQNESRNKPLVPLRVLPTVSGRTPLSRIEREIKELIAPPDFEALQALDGLQQASTEDTYQYCLLLHKYIVNLGNQGDDTSFTGLADSLDKWASLTADIRTSNRYGDPQAPLSILIASIRKQLKRILTSEIQQYYPNYQQQQALWFEEIKGHLKHVESNYNALINRLKQPNPSHSSLTRDTARAHYTSYIIGQLNCIIRGNHTSDEMQDALKQLLQQARSITNGTTLSYSSQPDDPVNHLLYHIAIYAANTTKQDEAIGSVLQVLIPGITPYCTPEVTGLGAYSIGNVFRTHMFSSRTHTLVPLVSVIDAVVTVGDGKTLEEIAVPNVYGDLDPNKEGQYYLSFRDVEPAFSHSDEMRRLQTLRTDYDISVNQDPIMANLSSLCGYLSNSSASKLGSTVETQAEELVYAGLPEKLFFYTDLTEKERCEFPTEVKEALDHLISVTGNPEARANEEGVYGTCLDLRTEEIRQSVTNNKKALSELSKKRGLIQDENLALVTSKLQECEQGLRRKIADGTYCGYEKEKELDDCLSHRLTSWYQHANPVPIQGNVHAQQAQRQESDAARRAHWTDRARNLLNEVAKQGIPEMEKLVTASDSNCISYTALIVMGIDSLLQAGKYKELTEYIDKLNAITAGKSLREIGLNVRDSFSGSLQLCLGSNMVHCFDFQSIVCKRTHIYLNSQHINSHDSIDFDYMHTLIPIHNPTLYSSDRYERAEEEIAHITHQSQAREVTSTYKTILSQLRAQFRERAVSPDGKHNSLSGSPVKFRNIRDQKKDAEFDRLLLKPEVTKEEVAKLVNTSTARHVGIFSRFFTPTTKKEFAKKAKEYPILSASIQH